MQRGRGGVEYEDIVVGEGAIANRGCVVEVEYSLSLNRGDTVQENQRYSFQLGGRRVIAGLDYGVEGMRTGGTRRIRVSPHLAYGETGVPDTIPKNAVLEFKVSLLNVEPGTSE